MKSSKRKGIDAEKLVQKKLWKFNYKVRTLGKSDYDLLVEEKIRVEVKSAKMQKSGSWTFSFGGKTPVDGYSDIHALVFMYPDESSKVAYIKTHELAQVMRENKSRWGVTFRRTNDDPLKKSPYEVFGYPQGYPKKGLTTNLG